MIILKVMSLVPLFTTSVDYTASSWRRIDLMHGYKRMMFIELHAPSEDLPSGYFSTGWFSAVSDRDGMKAVAESYARLRRSYALPEDSNKLMNNYREEFGDVVDVKIIIGKRNTMSASSGCSLDDGIMQVGLQYEDRPFTAFADELLKAEELPKEFEFFRIDSPYCALYHGGNQFIKDVRETGMISHLNLSGEIVKLYKATAIHKLPPGHLRILQERLDDLLNHLSKPSSN